MDPLAFALIATPLGALLVFLQIQHLRRLRRARAGLFDHVLPLIDDARPGLRGLGYPTLSGSYAGCPIRLEPIVDTLTLGRLPVLWLQVSYQRPLNIGASLDLLVRPTGNEFFSPNADVAGQLTPSPGLPSHVRIASPRPDAAPPVSLFEADPAFLHDPRTKEIHVSRTGVRVVWRLAHGDQTHYRSSRRPDFGALRLDQSDLLPVLHAIRAYGDALADPPASLSPDDAAPVPLTVAGS